MRDTATICRIIIFSLYIFILIGVFFSRVSQWCILLRNEYSHDSWLKKPTQIKFCEFAWKIYGTTRDKAMNLIINNFSITLVETWQNGVSLPPKLLKLNYLSSLFHESGCKFISNFSCINITWRICEIDGKFIKRFFRTLINFITHADDVLIEIQPWI